MKSARHKQGEVKVERHNENETMMSLLFVSYYLFLMNVLHIFLISTFLTQFSEQISKFPALRAFFALKGMKKQNKYTYLCFRLD